MRNRRNYYRMLHVQQDAPPAVIKASYRAIMQRLAAHPDLGGDAAQAALLNEAYDTLIDPARRAAYDRAIAGRVEQQRGHGRPAPAAPTPADPAPTAHPPAPTATNPAPTAAPPARTPAPPARTATAPAGGPACAFCGAACTANDVAKPHGVCVSCGSALFPARQHRPGGGSRRAMERAPRHYPMTFCLARSRQTIWNGTTEDVSLNGMRFLSPMTLQVGERVRIECDFCSAVAVVTGLHPGTHARGAVSCGVEFLTLLVKRDRGGLVSTEA